LGLSIKFKFGPKKVGEMEFGQPNPKLKGGNAFPREKLTHPTFLERRILGGRI